MNKLLPALAIVWCASSFPAMCQKMIIFGDCLSDTKENTRNMRNGKLWTEMAEEKFGLTFCQDTNYAQSGDNTEASLRKALTINAMDPKDIVISMIGTYDCLQLFVKMQQARGDAEAFRVLESKMDATIAESIGRIKESAIHLHKVGGRRFFLGTLPDMSLTPAVLEHGAEGAELAKKIIDSFNRQACELVKHFKTPGNHSSDMGEIAIVDVHGALEKTRIDARGVDESKDFYDAIHPSSLVHKKVIDLIASETKEYIKQ